MTKGIAPIGNTVEVGDTITYTLTLSHTAQSFAHAYNINVADVLPTQGGVPVVTYGGTASGTCGATVTYTAGSANVQFTVASLTLGSSCTIVYSMTVNSSALMDTNYVNSATIASYTTTPDPDDGRTYPPTTPVTATFTPDTGDITKVVTASNNADTTPDNMLAIGEEVTYTVTVTMPIGTRENVTVTDNLPTSTVDLAFVSATLTGVGSNLTSTLPVGSTASISGTTATWNFGTLVNSGASATLADHQLVFTIVAIVRDQPVNVGLLTGQVLNQLNIATLNYTTPTPQGGTPIEHEDDAPIGLVEPELAIAKSSSTSTTTVEPGDTVTYTLTISHTGESTASAYNVEVSDLLPTEGGAPAVTFTAINSTASTCDEIAGFATDASSLPTVTFSFDTLPLGSSCTIVYDVVVTTNVLMDTTYSNLALVESYTTTPGDPTDPENRTEDPTDDEESDFTTGTGALVKDVTATNNADTTGNTVTIGEEVTYTITATLPRGERDNIVIEDVLPANVVFDVLQARLTTVGSGITPTTILNTDAVQTGTTLTWNLGTLTNSSPTPNTATSQLVFTVVLRIADDPENVGLALPSQDTSAINVATLRYTTPDGNPVEYQDDEEIDLIEGAIQLDKTADLDTALAGDTVSYQVVVTHTPDSTFNAYDLVITDPLTSGLNLVVGSVTASTTGSGTPTIVTGNTAGNTTIRVDLNLLELGETLTITYQAVIATATPAGVNLVNVATVTGETTPCLGAVPCPGREIGDDDDHEVEVTPPTLTKSVVDTSQVSTGTGAYDPSVTDLTIGETVTYEVNAYIQEGSYQLRLIDALPDGFSIVSSEIIQIGANISGSVLNVGDSGTHTGTTVEFDFGTIANVNDNVRDDNDLVIVQIVARALDVTSNTAGATKINTVTIYYGASTETAEVPVEIVEPDVELNKSFNTTLIAVNEPFTMTLVLTNTGTATAYDLVLADPFDPYLELIATPIVDMSAAPNSAVTSDSSVLGYGGTVAYTFNQLAVGETITITAQVRISALITASPYNVVNTARVTSDTIPSGHPDDEYGRETTTTSTAEVLGAQPTLEVVKTANPTQTLAGQPVTYTITVRNTGDPAVNSHHLVITDTLADYTSFISVTSDMGTCAGGSETVTCTVALLQPNQTMTIQVTVATDRSAPDGIEVVNTVNVTSDENITERATATVRLNQPVEGGEICVAGCQQVTVYHTNRDGNWEIYRIGDIAGQEDAPENLTRRNSTDFAPSLSPDSNWFAFVSDRDGNWEIYVAPTNGQVELTRRITYNSVAVDTDPVWGPNNMLVYESTRDGNWELYAFDLETGVETRLTENDGSDINPFWSSDGSRLVFQSDRSGTWQLYELTLQTANLRLLSDGSTQDVDGAYNPANSLIAFRTVGEDGNSVIHVMNADGSNRRAISDSAGDASNAVWSPDGSLIAYQSDLDGDLDIYIYQLSTGLTRQLTDNNVDDFAPTWLCGTTTLIWTSEEGGNPDIFSAPALGINDAPISAIEEAEHLVDDPADDVYAESAPSEENASQAGRLPQPILDNANQPDYLNVSLSVTPVDQSRQAPSWAPLDLCHGFGVRFFNTDLNPNLYPVR